MNTDYNKGGSGYVLIEVAERFKEKNGGIIIDTSYDPMRHTHNYGTVIQLPLSMGMIPVEQKPTGFPGYGPVRGTESDSDDRALYSLGVNMKFKYTKDIAPEIEIGDKIYFKPRVLANETNQVDKRKDANGKTYFTFRVSYDQIYCKVKEYDITDFDGSILIGTQHGMNEEVLIKQFKDKFKRNLPDIDQIEIVKENNKVSLKHIVPIGTWTLLKPIWEDWDMILKPTYYPTLGPNGKPAVRPKDQWLQIKRAPDMDKMRGIVDFIGSPWLGETTEIKKGMTVAFRPIAKFIQSIEGEERIVVRQNNILAELEA